MTFCVLKAALKFALGDCKSRKMRRRRQRGVGAVSGRVNYQR
jgi:hypothetical protein